MAEFQENKAKANLALKALAMWFLLFASVLLAEYVVTSIEFEQQGTDRCSHPPCPFRPSCRCPPCPKYPITSANGRCKSGWTYYKETDACYKTFFWATFDDAERRCESYGGHLTSVHSDDENDFIIEMSHTGYNRTAHRMLTWIGLRQADYPKSKDWTWTDGTNVDFLPWAPTEPNNANGNERCAQVHSDHGAEDADPFGKWNDIYCDHTMRSYVCKKMAMH
ncbi:unnamed protein product [Cylicocyclus nassatus]|uniref:C-type lectin domain-containing protein n=1 Tax=Cylicocyclus nassatus TaxID=53992 RepID=A0AA36GLI7_CYLNA|nr:unnamed protein product [Cylicocyclus nassatus]